MQGNVLGQSGGSSSLSGLNVYTQLAEPREKDGIWIKTEETEVDRINYEKMEELPYEFYYGSAVVVGTEIYLFGTFSSNQRNKAYKYDTVRKEYIRLKDIPYNFWKGSAVVIGTEIYLLGGYDSSNNAYKYNTLTDTYEKLRDIPYSFSSGSAVAIGTEIYLLGTEYNSNYSKYAYKYNILKNTYTKLAEIPYEFYQGSAVGIETDIYLFGTNSSGQRNKAYKYDTKTNEYTKITDIPVAEFYNKCVVSIGTDIYLIDIYNIYKYNTITNEYIALEEKLPYDFLSGSTVIINKNIYLLGGSYKIEYAKQAYKLTVTITQPEITKYKYDKVELVEEINSIKDETYIKDNKTIFIESQKTFKANLTKILKIYFSNAYIYDNNNIVEYPVYYGNGEEWINIKTQKASRSIITEDGKEIKTEDNKIIEKEEE